MVVDFLVEVGNGVDTSLARGRFRQLSGAINLTWRIQDH